MEGHVRRCIVGKVLGYADIQGSLSRKGYGPADQQLQRIVVKLPELAPR